MENSKFLQEDNIETQYNNNNKETEKKQDQLDELLKDYFFEQQEEFSPKDLRRLARLQRKNIFKRNKWAFEDEIKRCNLMKKLESYLLAKNEEYIGNFWKRNENEYRDYFGRSKEKESKTCFENLKHGILNEIIANKILENLSDFQFSITNSEVDINYKIDIIGFSNDNKIILAVQVKQGSRYKKEKIQVVQEIDGKQKNEKEKNDFLNGCSRLKDELKLDDKNIILKNIWLIIPANKKFGESGKYSNNLQNVVINDIKKILKLESQQ